MPSVEKGISRKEFFVLFFANVLLKICGSIAILEYCLGFPRIPYSFLGLLKIPHSFLGFLGAP